MALESNDSNAFVYLVIFDFTAIPKKHSARILAFTSILPLVGRMQPKFPTKL